MKIEVINWKKQSPFPLRKIKTKAKRILSLLDTSAASKLRPKGGGEYTPLSVSILSPSTLLRMRRKIDLEDKTLSIVLTGDRGIKELNCKYLNKNRATDVLTFSMLEGKKIGNRKLLGDIVISLDTAKRAARHFKRSFEEEVYLYLIHGVLHLIGYRDGRLQERRAMERLQNKILKSI